MTDKSTGPVLIDLETPGPSPAEAPAVEDQLSGAAMVAAADLVNRRPSTLARWFWGSLTAFLTFALSVAAWDFVTGLVARNSYLGAVALALLGLFVLVCLIVVVREWAALSRLSRIDAIQHAAHAATSLEESREVADKLERLYAQRPEMEWSLKRFAERRGDVFDAPELLKLAETELLSPLDQRAVREVESAARQVAAVTALVPLALADVAGALTANLRMIRRLATIYGGRGGTFGAWRLTRAVFSHLVATGVVAVGDDMIGSVAGGGVLSRLSRRFGEGLINGALTARVGVAAMEVCRPLPFSAGKRPSVSALVSRAVTGLFDKKDD